MTLWLECNIVTILEPVHEIVLPNWVKSNAGWWSNGFISDDDFVKGIQYLVEQGIIKV